MRQVPPRDELARRPLASFGVCDLLLKIGMRRAPGYVTRVPCRAYRPCCAASLRHFRSETIALTQKPPYKTAVR